MVAPAAARRQLFRPGNGTYSRIREQSIPVALVNPIGFRASVLALGSRRPDLPLPSGHRRPSHEGRPPAVRVRPAATALPNSPWEATEPPAVRGTRRGSGGRGPPDCVRLATLTGADPQVHVSGTKVGARSVPMVSPGSTDPRGWSAPRLSHVVRTPPSGTPSPTSGWAVGNCHHREGHELAVSATRSAAGSAHATDAEQGESQDAGLLTSPTDVSPRSAGGVYRRPVAARSRPR